MSQILIRNLDSELVAELKERARRHRRSLQGEVATILERAIALGRDRHRFLHEAAALRSRLAGRSHTDSADLLAADRAR